VPDRIVKSDDLTFAAAVASFGMVLRQSEHRGSATFAQAIALASDAIGEDRGGYRSEFIELMRKAQALQRMADAQEGR
jgi:Ca-activated chloride channel family protein